MKVKKNCTTLPDGRIEIEAPGYGMNEIYRMDKERAIKWIKNNAPSHVIYIIDGKEYCNEDPKPPERNKFGIRWEELRK